MDHKPKLSTLFLAFFTIVLLALWITWFVLWKTVPVVGLITMFYPPNVSTSVTAIAAVGFLAMCIIQGVRALIPVRSWFHRWKLNKWLRSDSQSKDDAKKCFDDIITLTNAKDSSAFFDMPIEQVCGQLSAVAELVMSEKPIQRQELLRACAGQAASEQAIALSRSEEGDRDKIGYAIQRNIDSLQIEVTSSWRRALRIAAMLISAVIAYGVLSRPPAAPPVEARQEPLAVPDINTGPAPLPVKRQPMTSLSTAKKPLPVLSVDTKPPLPRAPEKPPANPIERGDKLMTAIAVGLVAGFLASVFRDLVAIIERMRRA